MKHRAIFSLQACCEVGGTPRELNADFGKQHVMIREKVSHALAFSSGFSKSLALRITVDVVFSVFFFLFKLRWNIVGRLLIVGSSGAGLNKFRLSVILCEGSFVG
jgi:hypothetical protein